MMLSKSLTIIAVFTATFITVSVSAHDPSMHKKENAEKPNCVAFEKMDQSQMDPNDPVIQAMMKQCMSDHHPEQGRSQSDDGHHGGHHSDEKK